MVELRAVREELKDPVLSNMIRVNLVQPADAKEHFKSPEKRLGLGQRIDYETPFYDKHHKEAGGCDKDPWSTVRI